MHLADFLFNQMYMLNQRQVILKKMLRYRFGKALKHLRLQLLSQYNYRYGLRSTFTLNRHQRTSGKEGRLLHWLTSSVSVVIMANSQGNYSPYNQTAIVYIFKSKYSCRYDKAAYFGNPRPL